MGTDKRKEGQDTQDELQRRNLWDELHERVRRHFILKEDREHCKGGFTKYVKNKGAFQFWFFFYSTLILYQIRDVRMRDLIGLDITHYVGSLRMMYLVLLSCFSSSPLLQDGENLVQSPGTKGDGADAIHTSPDAQTLYHLPQEESNSDQKHVEETWFNSFRQKME